MRRAICLILCLFLLSSFSTPANKTESIAQTIALKKHHHMYFIEVMMNGKKGNLLIDTGAAFTIFDINQASKYGFKYLKGNEEIKLVGLNGQSDRYSLINYKIKHENNILLIHAYGADLKSLANSFSNNGLDILGIVGSDYFTTVKAIIDYKNGQLIIHN